MVNELLASPYQRCMPPKPSEFIRSTISFHLDGEISFKRIFIRYISICPIFSRNDNFFKVFSDQFFEILGKVAQPVISINSILKKIWVVRLSIELIITGW